MSKSKAELPSLSKLIPPERIALNIQAVDWQEAIRISGKLLLDSQIISPEYIDAMIATAEELKQYIVIAPGIAMPHARPEAGALQTGMSLVTLAPPINFGNHNHDPVRLVFALAALDKHLHVRAMQNLAELLLSKELVSQLMAANSIPEVQAVFTKAEAMK